MTVLELMDAVAAGIEALAVAPLSTFSAYVTTPLSRREISDGAVFIDLGEEGAGEKGIGIAGGVGRFEVVVPLEIVATWHAEDTDTDRDKGFTMLEQLAKFVRVNRSITAGGETARYGTWSGGKPGYLDEGRDDESQMLRAVTVKATWTIPQDTD